MVKTIRMNVNTDIRTDAKHEFEKACIKLMNNRLFGKRMGYVKNLYGDEVDHQRANGS